MIISIQQPEFFPWLGYFDKISRVDQVVILDNVQFRLSIKNLDKSESKDKAMYWIEKVGLTGFENKFPNQ